ncbi:hypothetical protein ACO0K0_19665 [Undibacterium sp. SXout11W]|uniref:hypothetical protein n=1 Tax=Undibacterium sp. SXout11W TaxID=3413050 RepID=UPI003BF2C204
MASLPFSLWLFFGFAALAYLAAPPFLEVLNIQLSSTFEQLGEPSFGTIFSRDPNNWESSHQGMPAMPIQASKDKKIFNA